MSQHLVIEVFIFLGVMIGATVLPALFIIAGVVIMKAWMSPKRRVAAPESGVAAEEEEVESQS
jgi:hypothetical protein